MWIANRILFPDIVSHLNSDFFGKKITTLIVGEIRMIQEESSSFQRKNDLNLNGFICLKHNFSLKRQCFCRESFV